MFREESLKPDDRGERSPVSQEKTRSLDGGDSRNKTDQASNLEGESPTEPGR